MRKVFNSVCDECDELKHNCAKVYLRELYDSEYHGGWLVWCEDCRREQKGKYRVAAEHKR